MTEIDVDTARLRDNRFEVDGSLDSDLASRHLGICGFDLANALGGLRIFPAATLRPAPLFVSLAHAGDESPCTTGTITHCVSPATMACRRIRKGHPSQGRQGGFAFAWHVGRLEAARSRPAVRPVGDFKCAEPRSTGRPCTPIVSSRSPRRFGHGRGTVRIGGWPRLRLSRKVLMVHLPRGCRELALSQGFAESAQLRCGDFFEKRQQARVHPCCGACVFRNSDRSGVGSVRCLRATAPARSSPR